MIVSTLKTVIVDDEHHAIENLKMVLEQYGFLEVVGEAQQVDDAVNSINKLKPDVVFLDINLSGSTGFDVLDRVKYRGFDLVFVTAYNQHAIRAFDYGAINYLLKPLKERAVHDTVMRLLEFQNPMDNEAIERIFRRLKQEERLPQIRRLTFNSATGIIFKSSSDVLFFRANGNFTIMHLVTGDKVVLDHALKHIEIKLDGLEFYRIHNHTLINCSQISVYNSKTGIVGLKDGTVLEVAFRRRGPFLRYLKGQIIAV
jgi:two-component system LytT family response regulator